MKKIFTLLLLAFITVSSYAQHGALYFTGPSSFSAMGATEEVATDTVILKLDISNMTADITLPKMYYTGMGLTVPGFTISGVPFEGSYASGGYTFNTDSYTAEVVDALGDTKKYTGKALTATYNHQTQAFNIETTFQYGRMPGDITYKFDGAYDRAATGITNVEADKAGSDAIYDLQGRRVSQPQRGQLYIKNGKKYLVK